MRTPENISSLRLASSNLDVANGHFDRLHDLYSEHKYSAANIWNADETSACIKGKELKVLAPKGSHRVLARSTEGGVSTTVSALPERRCLPFSYSRGKITLLDCWRVRQRHPFTLYKSLGG